MFIFQGVLPENIDRVWPQVAELLTEAVLRSKDEGYTLEGVYEELKENLQQLWLCIDINTAKPFIAGTTKVYTDTAGEKVCFILFMGGSRLADTFRTFEWIEDWAKAEGCSYITSYCRPGIYRKFLNESNGWEYVAHSNKKIIVEKRI